jgi:hypothetical protein
MLEQNGVLATFRLEEEPAQALMHEVRAVKIFDHPLRFLTYEGPVQKGAGQVRIVDSGVCRSHEHSEDLWVLEFEGTILKGVFALTRVENAEWQFSQGGA